MNEFREFNFKIRDQSKVVQTMFIRQHRVKERHPGKPMERTLFIVGVPPCIEKDSLNSLFSRFGVIENVFLHENPTPTVPAKESQYFDKKTATGFKYGYVVFKECDGLEKALETQSIEILKSGSIVSGVKKWAKDYNESIPPDGILQKEIDLFMSKYDNQDEINKKREKDATEPDDEGWVTVTKKSRKPGFARKESVMKQLSETMEKKKGRKELTNFYRFQIKESKMKNLVTLRKKFEEDKKKIAALKATRRFKPF